MGQYERPGTIQKDAFLNKQTNNNFTHRPRQQHPEKVKEVNTPLLPPPPTPTETQYIKNDETNSERFLFLHCHDFHGYEGPLKIIFLTSSPFHTHSSASWSRSNWANNEPAEN